jgi:hypothetical protein
MHMLTHKVGAYLTRWAAAPLVAALLIAACRGSLLDVETPDQITTEQANSPSGAAALRVAAIGNFAAFYGGDVGGSFHGINITSGMLADEIESARGGTEHLDSRAQNENIQPLTTTWTFVGQATTQLVRAIRALKQYAPEGTAAEKATKATQIAQLYALHGFAFILIGENYCNGVPIADVNDQNPSTENLSNQDLFNRALAQFDTALQTLGTGTGDQDIRNLVAVGRGRAYLDLGAYAQAAAAVATVPTSFVYNIQFSETTIVNAIYDWMFGTLNYAPPDREGTNGVNWVTARDPRVPVQRDASGNPVRRAGQDGIQHYVQTKYTRGNDPVVLASGVEARLIEAEALLKANDPTWITKVNEARRTVTGLTDLTPGATTAANVDLLFRERAFFFWGTAHRLGDLRRLIRQYGRNPESVFPTGSYFKGGAFGADVNLVPAQQERNNPDYPGCSSTEA